MFATWNLTLVYFPQRNYVFKYVQANLTFFIISRVSILKFFVFVVFFSHVIWDFDLVKASKTKTKSHGRSFHCFFVSFYFCNQEGSQLELHGYKLEIYVFMMQLGGVFFIRRRTARRLELDIGNQFVLHFSLEMERRYITFAWNIWMCACERTLMHYGHVFLFFLFFSEAPTLLKLLPKKKVNVVAKLGVT